MDLSKPTAGSLPKLCASAACQRVLTAVKRLGLGDCTLLGMKLETDLVAPIETACAGSSWVTTTATTTATAVATGSSAGSSSGSPDDTAAVTVTTTPAPVATTKALSSGAASSGSGAKSSEIVETQLRPKPQRRSPPRPRRLRIPLSRRVLLLLR